MPAPKRSDFATAADLLAALRTGLIVDGVEKSRDLIALAMAEPDASTRLQAEEMVDRRRAVEATLGKVAPAAEGFFRRYGSMIGGGLLKVFGPRIQGLLAGLVVILAGVKGTDWVRQPPADQAVTQDSLQKAVRDAVKEALDEAKKAPQPKDQK